jgi:hypothetical protein
MHGCDEILLFFAPRAMLSSMGRWCSVCLIDSEGRRYSLDVQADSTFDAAHLYATHVQNNPACGLPIATIDSNFEVAIQGKFYRVHGKDLQKWIEQRRKDLNGPRGMLFSQQPLLRD